MLKIIWQDSDFLVVAKPSGMPVHEGPGVRKPTLAGELLRKFPALRGVGEDSRRPGIVHRLDRDASGVLVIARKQRAFRRLKRQFKRREVFKCYLGLASGAPPAREGLISLPLQRHPRDRRLVIPATRQEKEKREALTFWKVLRRHDGCALLALYPRTGRRHQLRVHCAALGIPLLGDHWYGNKATKNSFPRLWLHAWQLGFWCFSKARCIFRVFSAALPPELREDLRRRGMAEPRLS